MKEENKLKNPSTQNESLVEAYMKGCPIQRAKSHLATLDLLERREDEFKYLREERDALAAQNVAMRESGEHLARSISSYVGLTGDSGIAMHAHSAILNWSKALSLTPTEAVERMRQRLIPNDVIAARFILGRGSNQKIAYWDADNPDDTGSTPLEAIEAARKEGLK